MAGSKHMNAVDVAILGGGLAGNLLARQIRRQIPDASVAVFERTTERTFKVGESTVEIATNYLVRRLGLSTYIYKEHLPKNGLRFFFDTERKDATLPNLSEIGVHALPPYPSFQLDRARLEADLIRLNRADGVQVVEGVRVTDLELSADGGHSFRVVDATGAAHADRTAGDSWRARWVVDATGREGVVAKLRDLKRPERDHRVGAAWGRFRGVVDMDQIDAPEWHARARHTSRVLSTNHFCYPGYWIWFIPLRDGLTSVGVVQEAKGWNRSMHEKEGFQSFLGEHRAVGDLMRPAEMVDFGAFSQLAFRTRQFFSAERWGCVGDAAAFADPFYSPGSDFISVENDLVCDLIEKDLRGENIEETARLYDDHMHFRLDVTMTLYEGLYPVFGSYELFRAKAFFDTACYYNLWFDAYARDLHFDARWLRTLSRRRSWVMATMKEFRTLFLTAAEEMHRRGTFYRQNTEHYELEGREAFGVMEEVGVPRSRRDVNARSEAIFAQTRQMVREALDGDLLAERAASSVDAWSQLDTMGSAL